MLEVSVISYMDKPDHIVFAATIRITNITAFLVPPFLCHPIWQLIAISKYQLPCNQYPDSFTLRQPDIWSWDFYIFFSRFCFYNLYTLSWKVADFHAVLYKTSKNVWFEVELWSRLSYFNLSELYPSKWYLNTKIPHQHSSTYSNPSFRFLRDKVLWIWWKKLERKEIFV